MTDEASLERTEEGHVPAGPGWFVMNAREARWIKRDRRGHNLPFTGWTEEEAEGLFPQLGMALIRLEPGEPVGMYHWEADQEDFLVLAGEPLLVVEGEERPLRQWDFVHCPPGTKHIIVGAGEGPSLVLAAGSREHLAEHCGGGAYVADEIAARHGASPVDPEDPYAQFADSEPTPYQEGWLPDA